MAFITPPLAGNKVDLLASPAAIRAAHLRAIVFVVAPRPPQLDLGLSHELANVGSAEKVASEHKPLRRERLDVDMPHNATTLVGPLAVALATAETLLGFEDRKARKRLGVEPSPTLAEQRLPSHSNSPFFYSR